MSKHWLFCSFYRIASSNNTSKSESDQEDNDDVNDNDWSYGSEKKGELIQSVCSTYFLHHYLSRNIALFLSIIDLIVIINDNG